MAVHRYWRAIAMEAYGAGDLEVSCFHLLDGEGARVDAPATLTASSTPAAGVLANLQDDDLSTAARWGAQSVAALSLNWDFGASPVDVADIRLAGDSNTRFPLIIKIQYSDDASSWVDAVVFAGITWPGIGVKTSSSDGAVVRNTVRGRLASTDPIALGAGPTIIYGTAAFAQTVNLTVESGSIKDTTSGVLGTGRGRIYGTVKEKGTPDSPVHRRVRLIRERDSLLMREVWSDPVTGAYEFNFIDELQTWTVVSYDHTHGKLAVIADNRTPEIIA